MTHDASRGGRSPPSGPEKKQKKASSALLAAVSILSASLGVTAAQAAGEIDAMDGGSAHDVNTKVAALSNQLNDAAPSRRPKLQAVFAKNVTVTTVTRENGPASPQTIQGLYGPGSSIPPSNPPKLTNPTVHVQVPAFHTNIK